MRLRSIRTPTWSDGVPGHECVALGAVGDDVLAAVQRLLEVVRVDPDRRLPPNLDRPGRERPRLVGVGGAFAVGGGADVAVPDDDGVPAGAESVPPTLDRFPKNNQAIMVAGVAWIMPRRCVPPIASSSSASPSLAMTGPPPRIVMFVSPRYGWSLPFKAPPVASTFS